MISLFYLVVRLIFHFLVGKFSPNSLQANIFNLCDMSVVTRLSNVRQW
jgi:hypothetical protein